MRVFLMKSWLVTGFLWAITFAADANAQQASTWNFAVAGDSRNCGDIVMPAIAAGATANKAEFYWHLGDLRAIYDFDQDIVRSKEMQGRKEPLTIAEYERIAWDDYIQHQISAFGSMPFYLGIGNHETYTPKDRSQFLIQFADWLDMPALRDQRLADNPADHRLKTFFHWKRSPVDFIYMDNATPDQFDREQMAWFEHVLSQDKQDPEVKSVVVGMHAALPDSLAANHSMGDWASGEKTGRQVYSDLLGLQQTGHKNVYILASHTHFYIANVFNSEYWKTHGGVLPGWIIGTGGAVRYALPPTANQADDARTNVYGYLLGTVQQDGTISFSFREITEKDVPASVLSRYSKDVVDECFDKNSLSSK